MRAATSTQPHYCNLLLVSYQYDRRNFDIIFSLDVGNLYSMKLPSERQINSVVSFLRASSNLVSKGIQFQCQFLTFLMLLLTRCYYREQLLINSTKILSHLCFREIIQYIFCSQSYPVVLYIISGMQKVLSPPIFKVSLPLS